MIVTLLKQDGMNSISLPEKAKGQFWINDYSVDETYKPLISVEGVQGSWILKANRNVWILDGEKRHKREQIIEPYNLYCLYIKGKEEYVYLFVEPMSIDRQQYEKYIVNSNRDIYVGRAQSNQIYFYNVVVSSTHARFSKENGRWVVYDEDSTNGIYVNHARVKEKYDLVPGDVVYIMGLKIIIGNGFWAINNPDQMVRLEEGIFSPYYIEQMREMEEDDEWEEEEVEFFYRSPRFKRDIKTKTVKIDSPPNNQKREEMPLMMTIGPSMTMGLASLTTAIFAVNNAIRTGNISSAIPSIVMSMSMLLGTVLWPVIAKRYERKKAAENERKRQYKYRNYLSDRRNEIEQEIQKQKKILEENFLTNEECQSIIKKAKSSLWEREPGQNDFLKLRVGMGGIEADIKYSYQERRFMLEDDNLQDEMLAICENPKKIEEAPIVVSLFENYISGVVGSRNDTLAFAKGLLLQMLTYYSYDEFKIVLLIDPKELQEFETMRWIPHFWDNERKQRFIATDPGELKQLSSYLEQVMKWRLQLHEEERKDCTPYYMIMAFDRTLANKADMLKFLYQQKAALNVGVITFFDEIKDLPKECTTVMELKGNTGRIFNKKDISGERIVFTPDIYVRKKLDLCNMQLANIQLDIMATAYNLPKMLTFLEMYQVGKIEHLNALSRWKENDPTTSLEVPIGVDTFGETFKLDLHEKYHGPHGLVAGMTGSGKSEFIMTYILSLALNYHPYEVAFILIDYKGGGMAKAFEQLPHTAGIITNLDGAAVNRSLISIQSELKRRQAIFADVSKRLGESNIDIYKYQKLYREGLVAEPLQHLFIISDEFAELKTQQPEFMEQLISAARIGRSLGVHLILATQKPAGVVDDQIWSNSKFKICLKVQERADSMDMLKRPDAAELSDTGRFYLQVGYNELFELGQSAWAGAPYYPSEHVLKERDDEVEVINLTGNILKKAKPKRKNIIKNPPKQLDAITEYLRQTADNEHIKVRPLWLEPISAFIYIDDLEEKYGVTKRSLYLNPIVGEYDDPSRQRQDVLCIPISENGNVAVFGAAGMGKTTFLNAMLYSLIKHHSDQELNIYILDFSSESLRAFENAPQVGDVMVSGDDEKIENMFKLLSEEMADRRKKFADHGGDMQSYVKESEESIQNIIIVIHNFAAFVELYEQHEEDVIYFSREGTKYGIYFVITAVNTNDVRYRILQNFKQMYVLQLNDNSDYATVLGNVNGVFPSKCKGRGIFKDDQVYEFQAAYISEKGENTIGFIQEYCRKLREKYGEGNTKKIPVLPDSVTVDQIPKEYLNGEGVPVGISKSELKYQYLDINQQVISFILGQDMKDIIPKTQGIIEVLIRMNLCEIIVLDPKSVLKIPSNISHYTTDMEEHIIKMFECLVYRNNTYKASNGEITSEMDFHPIIYVMQDYAEIYEQLSIDGKDKLKILLEKNEPEYYVRFILSEEVGNMAIRTVESWHKKHCAKGTGVYVGSGITDQYVLKVNGMDKELRMDLPSDFGFVVNNGAYCLSKLLTEKKSKEEMK